MRLDAVHDLQAVFRELMIATAFPGSLRDIGAEAERIDIEVPLPKPMLAVALALLDAETRFSFRSEAREERENFVSRMSYARRAAAEESDFVFVLDGERNLAEAIAAAKSGTLVDPHLGATIVAGIASFGDGPALRLEGPGIRASAPLRAGPCSLWLAARSEKNREYPLGVDIVFVDALGRIAALPRTTRASAGDGSWAM